jgi:hypothetical protein
MKTLKIKNLLVAFVLGLLLVQPAISQTGTTFGMSDCGQWVSTSKSNFAVRAWLLGFMSGVNSGRATAKRDPLDKINSSEQIFLWMDNFCQKNPLKNVQEGGNILYLELEAKTR